MEAIAKSGHGEKADPMVESWRCSGWRPGVDDDSGQRDGELMSELIDGTFDHELIVKI